MGGRHRIHSNFQSIDLPHHHGLSKGNVGGSDGIPEFTVNEDFALRRKRRLRHSNFADQSLRAGDHFVGARANYQVLSVTGDSIEFAAQGFLTAYNIGLNHVALRRTGRDTIAYQVRFDRWNRYALLHGGLLGLMLAGAYLLPATQQDLRRFPHGEWIFLGMTLFWSLAWPWLMTALHRPFASMALERILREELARDAGARANDLALGTEWLPDGIDLVFESRGSNR